MLNQKLLPSSQTQQAKNQKGAISVETQKGTKKESLFNQKEKKLESITSKRMEQRRMETRYGNVLFVEAKQ